MRISKGHLNKISTFGDFGFGSITHLLTFVGFATVVTSGKKRIDPSLSDYRLLMKRVMVIAAAFHAF